MKKVLLFALIVVLGFSSISFASYNVNALLNKEYTIIYDGEEKNFYNGNGERVYPILFEGTNYLPLRAVSSLFNVAISWDGLNNTVRLGEGEINKASAPINSNLTRESNEEVVVLINQEVKVVYNGETQNFRMNVGDHSKTIYPITFKGTTYLPMRNITELFGCTIEWDGTNKIIRIKSLERIIEDSNSIVNGNNIYNNGDDFVMYNNDIYFRMYEESDYDKDEVSSLRHSYSETSGERIIGKIDSQGKVSEIFKDSSRGKFYILDDRFFFRNNEGDVYSTDLFGKNKSSFGVAEIIGIDEENHVLTILKNDGVYEINTVNLKSEKKIDLGYKVPLDTIESKYFSKDGANKIALLYEGIDRVYYWTSDADNFDVYSFDYKTGQNKKLASLTKELDLAWGNEKADNIKYITQYGENVYIYVYAFGGSVGDTVGTVWLIDSNGNTKEILKLNYGFLNYEIDDNLMYLHITDTAGSEQWYILHMDTNILSKLESNVQNYETNKLAQKADGILESYFTQDFCNKIIFEFGAEDLRQELNKNNTVGRGDMWDESVLNLIYRYDLNDKFVYECNVAVHGWPNWAGAYYRVGVIYFLVDTNSGVVKEIYRIKI